MAPTTSKRRFNWRKFFLSKINWVAFLTAILAIAQFLVQQKGGGFLNEQQLAALTFVSSFLTFVLRTFFTSEAILRPPLGEHDEQQHTDTHS